MLPEFQDRDEAHVKQKAERLAPAVDRALSRREPAREAPDYTMKPALVF